MGRLQKGVNDLERWCLNNGSFGKQLMSEWTGECTDGTQYNIDEISFGSNKKFKWKCSEGHEWYADVCHRTFGRKCPYCSGQHVSDKNSLKTWCLNNGLWGKQLIQEWTGECNDGKHYEIDEVSFGSSTKKFKWVCSKGHEWYARIRDRARNMHGCPQCRSENIGDIISKAMLSEENSLKTWCSANGSFGKQLKSEWTGLCEDGKHYKIDEVTYGSGRKKFKWKCSKGHEWYTDICNRTANKTGCPYCSGKRVSNENSLKTWCLSNGSYGQQLISEWTGECDDGIHYKIDEVSFGSNKKFRWRCSKGHEWYTGNNNRTGGRTGCPYCNNIGTSYPEQFIYHSLKQIYPSTENRCKVLKSPQTPQGVEFDIGIPEIPLCIEYSPTYWHEGREERDQYKNELCQKANVRLIQIVEDSYDEMPFKMEADYICFKMDENKKDEILTEIVDHILKSLGHSISEVDLEEVKQKAYESSKGIEKDIQDSD